MPAPFSWEVSSAFESEAELSHFYDVLGGFEVRGTAGSPHSSYDRIVRFFESLDPEARRDYHHIAQRVRITDNPAHYAEKLVRQLYKSDPTRRYDGASKLVLDEISKLRVWLGAIANDIDAPILETVHRGSLDTTFAQWVPAPSGPHARFNDPEKLTAIHAWVNRWEMLVVDPAQDPVFENDLQTSLAIEQRSSPRYLIDCQIETLEV